MILIKTIRHMRFPAALATFLMALLAAGNSFAQPQQTEKYCPFLPASPQTPGHPQPRPPASAIQLRQQNGITVLDLSTGHGCFAEVDPHLNPPGSNFLPTIYTNAFDGNGKEIPNTLRSTPDVPYNLHD